MKYFGFVFALLVGAAVLVTGIESIDAPEKKFVANSKLVNAFVSRNQSWHDTQARQLPAGLNQNVVEDLGREKYGFTFSIKYATVHQGEMVQVMVPMSWAHAK